MKKRLFATLVSVSLLSTMVLSGCGQNSTDEKVTSGVIRIAYNNIENYPHYKGLERAAQEIEDRSDGRFTVKIYSNGTLGDQRAALELTQNNAVQMCVANATMVESYNHDFSVLSMPYLFEDSDHQREAYTNGMLDELFDSTEEYDFKIVGAFGSGSRNIFCEKAVRTPEDLKGLKIRVMQSDNMVKMLQLMGGTGVPMSASEQYSAMQQGVVDGAESNEIDYVGKKYYEVAPVFSRTEHCFSTDFVVASTKFMNSLTDEDRKMIEDAMAIGVEAEFDSWSEMVDVACILIFGIMTILVVYQVVTRYVFQSPSSWSESVVTYGFIWLAMLGGAYVFGKRDHMAMTFVLDKFHGRVKTIIEMINELIIVLFGIGVLLIGGYAGAMKQMTQADSILPITMGVIYIAIPIAGVAMILYFLCNEYDLIKKLNQPETEGGKEME